MGLKCLIQLEACRETSTAGHRGLSLGRLHQVQELAREVGEAKASLSDESFELGGRRDHYLMAGCFQA